MAVLSPPRTDLSLTAAAAALALGACTSGSEPANNASNAAAPEPATSALRLPEAIPTPAPELDRAALIAAVAQAASAHAIGKDDREAQAELAGRRFTLRIRFGCGGPEAATAKGGTGWSYDEAKQTLTIRATPDIKQTPKAEAGEATGETPIEAIEGFWIPRPWVLSDACPAGADGEPTGAAAPPTVGLAQYYTADDSRVHRRSGRPYEIVRRAEPAIAPPETGFNLVLHGRLRAWPDAGVIRCTGSGRAARPACIVSAELDRVAFENPESGLTIAEWTAG